MAKATTPSAKTAPTLDPQRAKLDARVKALASSDVGPAPGYAAERIKFLARFVTAATRDTAELCAVALPDGEIDPSEIDVLPAALARAKELGDAVTADNVASGFKLARDDAAMLAETRKSQRKVIRTFRYLRFKGQPAKLQVLEAIDAGKPEDVVDAHDDSEKLIALATHPDERAWFSALKSKEPEALKVIQKHHARIGELAKEAIKHAEAAGRRDELNRVWTTIGRIERRVREGANYLYDGEAKREEYRAFKPESEKTRANALKAERAKQRTVKKAADAAKKAADAAAKKAAKAARKKG